MNFYNEEDNSGGDNKGKFSERLKKILKERLMFKRNAQKNNDDNELGIITFSRNILKVILVTPSFIYSHINNKDKEEKMNNGNTKLKLDNKENITDEDLLSLMNNDIKKIKVSKIRDIDINFLKKKREYLLSNKNLVNVSNNVSLDLDMEIRKKRLQKEIVDLIKKRLVKNINEFELLQSELYLLKEFGLDNIYFNKCQEDITEIKKLLSRINSLKDKYDQLKDNVDFQYMLEFDDNLLIDKILELKDICSRGDIINIIDDYKILEEYKYLYLKIDKLQEDAIKIEDERNKKALELKDRDINFDNFKDGMYDVDREKERFEAFVKQQEILLKDLDEKVSKIDSYELVNYKLKGFNKLLANSFKYLGLLLVNPLKGLIPGIATQTVITKNLVHNLYNNLSLEENRKMVYEGIDYSVDINNAINNLDLTSSLIDSTLEELVLLKSRYENEFSKYSNSISSYKEAIKKINKIENAVLGSKIKVESMKLRMKQKERENSNKLKRVKILNSSNN